MNYTEPPPPEFADDSNPQNPDEVNARGLEELSVSASDVGGIGGGVNPVDVDIVHDSDAVNPVASSADYPDNDVDADGSSNKTVLTKMLEQEFSYSAWVLFFAFSLRCNFFLSFIHSFFFEYLTIPLHETKRFHESGSS